MECTSNLGGFGGINFSFDANVNVKLSCEFHVG